MITAHLASLGSRRNLLPIVLQSISPHVDHIYVALNNYATIPELDIPNVTFKMCDNSKGDAHKFEFINDVEGLVLVTDDDLVWNEYAIYLLKEGVRKYKCPCSFHGKAYPRPFTTFKRFSGNYRCLNTVGSDTPCDIIGTGTLMFDTSMVKLSMQNFPYPNMGDVLFSKLCHDQGVKLQIIKHNAGIVGYLHPKETIWTSTKSYALHDSIIKDFLK